MTTPLDTTIKTIQDGLTHGPISQGVKIIDNWMNTLEDADFRGAKTIHENLGKLKRQLEAEHLDGRAIADLLRTLGEETVRAASHADGSQGEKIKQLGELLGQAAQGMQHSK